MFDLFSPEICENELFVNSFFLYEIPSFKMSCRHMSFSLSPNDPPKTQIMHDQKIQRFLLHILQYSCIISVRFKFLPGDGLRLSKRLTSMRNFLGPANQE